MTSEDASPPQGAMISKTRHRVAFYETDAMGIVHHANYLRFFERGRVDWLDEHDQPYRAWVELGIHFATTHVSVDYVAPTRFDDALEISTWVEWVRGASLRMAYRIECEGRLRVFGATEHAAVDDQGRVRRIPKEHRERFRQAMGEA